MGLFGKLLTFFIFTNELFLQMYILYVEPVNFRSEFAHVCYVSILSVIFDIVTTYIVQQDTQLLLWLNIYSQYV